MRCRPTVLVAAKTYGIPSNPRLHPGLDVDHRFPEGFIDHPFHRPVAAQRQVHRDRLRNRVAEVVARRPLFLCPDREVFLPFRAPCWMRARETPPVLLRLSGAGGRPQSWRKNRAGRKLGN